jgi:hypothetical protein
MDMDMEYYQKETNLEHILCNMINITQTIFHAYLYIPMFLNALKIVWKAIKSKY